jgi:hypothetical protein
MSHADVLSELGAEDGEGFLTYDQLNLTWRTRVYLGIYTDFLLID